MQKAGVMERRTDTGPDLGMFASLLQQAGQQQLQGRRVSTRLGPMASAGRNIFGDPFGGRRTKVTAAQFATQRQRRRATTQGPVRRTGSIRTGARPQIKMKQVKRSPFGPLDVGGQITVPGGSIRRLT